MENLQSQHMLLVRAVKVSLALLLAVLGGVCVWTSWSIPTYVEIFRDMMPGTSLPVLTRWVIQYSGLCLLVSISLPLLGFGLLLVSKSQGRAIILAAFLAAALFIEWQIITLALHEPFLNLLKQIGEGPK